MQGDTGDPTPTNLKVAVASPDQPYASALSAALSAYGQFTVIGQPKSQRKLVSLLDLGPDAVAIVLSPNDLDWEAISKVAARSSVLILGPDDEEVMIQALETGALGYLDVETPFAEIGSALQAIAAGNVIVPPEMLGSLLRHVVRRRRDERQAQDRLEILTSRERQVFGLVANGYDKQAIADELYISPETARTHIHNILSKLELHSQVEIVALAARCGWTVGTNSG